MKKKILLTLLAILCICALSFGIVSCSDGNDNDTNVEEPDVPLTPDATCQHTNLSHETETGSTCNVHGHTEYWFCGDCNKYFANEACTVETTLAAVTKAYGEHKYGEWIGEEPANCTDNGTLGHYHCSVCQKNFDADKEELDSLVILAHHSYDEEDWIAEVPAVDCETPGTKGHYHCDVCGGDFDRDGNEYDGFFNSLTITVPHELTLVPEVKSEDATCINPEHAAYWECDVCGNVFEDEHGIIPADIIKIPGEHNYVYTYNYTTCEYDGVCSHNSAHTYTMAAGTEAYPYLANDEASLKAAVGKGGYVKLMADITVVTNANGILIQKAVALDLNGHSISTEVRETTKCKVLWAYGTAAKVAVKNGKLINKLEQTPQYGAYASSGGELTLENVDIESSYYGIYVAKSSKLNMSGGIIKAEKAGILAYNGTETAYSDINIDGTDINATEIGMQLKPYAQARLTNCNITTVYNENINVSSDGIDIWSNAKLEIVGGSIITHRYGIVGNGSDSNIKIELTDVDISSYMGIYHPQKSSSITIKGGSIIGEAAAIEVRSGIVDINVSKKGGTVLTSKADSFSSLANGSGTTTNGVALAVSQHTTNEKIVVTLNGATLNGKFALYEKDLMDDDTPKDITITLGEGNTLNGYVYSENCENIVDTADDNGNALTETTPEEPEAA